MISEDVPKVISDNEALCEDVLTYEVILESMRLNRKSIKEYSPLALAFIGDCVYDMIIRSLVLAQGNVPPNKLHKKKTELVNAMTQAEIADRMELIMNQEESSIYRRGKNTKVSARAKNSSLYEYHKATGLEALLGYLYMEGRVGRILELVRYSLELDGSYKV